MCTQLCCTVCMKPAPPSFSNVVHLEPASKCCTVADFVLLFLAFLSVIYSHRWGRRRCWVEELANRLSLVMRRTMLRQLLATNSERDGWDDLLRTSGLVTCSLKWMTMILWRHHWSRTKSTFEIHCQNPSIDSIQQRRPDVDILEENSCVLCGGWMPYAFADCRHTVVDGCLRLFCKFSNFLENVNRNHANVKCFYLIVSDILDLEASRPHR